MISLRYVLSSYKAFLTDLSANLNVPLVNNTLHFPAEIGEGFISVIEFPDQVEALVYDFTLRHDLYLERKKDDREYYTFMCEEAPTVNELTLQIEQDSLNFEHASSAMYLTGFLYDISYHLKRDSHVRGVRALLCPEWLRHYLNLDAKQNVLQKYIELKTAGVLYKKLDAESKELLREILSGNRDQKPLLYYRSRITKLIEKFFDWLSEEMLSMPAAAHISRRDIEKAMIVESLLIGDLTAPPPTIPEMAKAVMMSESKLKKLFKEVYGYPPYVYFQKHRMDKARRMILSGNYTIKDVGFSLGYANLSNFTIAFKKEHGKLPSELLN